MLVGTNIGPVTASDGSQNIAARGDRLGGIVVTELRARYAENTRRGLRYHGANQAAVTTTVGLATTYTGLVLANPIGSPVWLELDKVGIATLIVWPAAAAIGIMVGYNGSTALTTTTVDGVYNANPALGAGYGQIFKAATLPTAPTLRKVLGAGLTGAITVTPETNFAFDLEGSIVLPPGGYAAIYTSTVGPTNGLFASMEWTEVPA